MQFIDLAAQQKRIRQDLEQRLLGVLDHGQYVMGKEIRELESSLAEYTGTSYGLGCASGTDALLLALMAYGVGPGDAVLTTPFTFIATAEVVSLLGATPVFVDIDPVTFNMDPDALERAIEAFATGDTTKHPLPAPCTTEEGSNVRWMDGACPLKPRGIIAVDIFGLPADYDRINAIARKHDMFVIEDGAQSFGGSYKGKKACGLADIGCTSFFPAKPLGCYGDGGMCFTNDKDLYETMVSLRVHGQGTDKYNNVRIGINGRIDTMQAAVLLSKFSIFPEEVALRQKAADRYYELIMRSGSPFVAPSAPQGYESVWAQYGILTPDESFRDNLLAHMRDQKVPTAVYYPKPLHMQDAFARLGYKAGDFPVTEDCARRIFSIPMHPYLDEETQKTVTDGMFSFVG